MFNLSGRKVEIVENGRSGSVTYREPKGTLLFYWEFGGNDIVAIVQVSDLDAWKRQPAWLAGRRAEVLQFVAKEVRRLRTPTSRVEINEQEGEILLRQPGASGLLSTAQPSPAGASSVPSDTAFVQRYSAIKSKLAGIVLIAAIIFGGIMWLRNKLFMINPGKGTPVGYSLRTDSHIATLIQTLEPYVPSLNRNHGNDTYRLSLFLVPLDGSEPKLIPIKGGLSPNSYSLAKVLGSDGRAIWFDAAEINGVDLKTFKVLPESELKGPPPEPAQTGSMGLGPKPEHHLADVWFTSATEWLGLHSPAEVDRHFEPRTFIKKVHNAPDEKEPRQFYRGVIESEAINDYLRIASVTPLSDEKFLGAAFLRMKYSTEPIRLANPDGALMIYTSAPGLTGTLWVARVDPTGKIAWKVDTGIDRFNLEQILPAQSSVAFIGPRPPIPNKVSEPLLVIVDNATGKVTTHSLWQ